MSVNQIRLDRALDGIIEVMAQIETEDAVPYGMVKKLRSFTERIEDTHPRDSQAIRKLVNKTNYYQTELQEVGASTLTLRMLRKVTEQLNKAVRGAKESRNLKQQLIRLGSQNPELRKHLKPVLDKISTDVVTLECPGGHRWDTYDEPDFQEECPECGLAARYVV
jgi:hypothetical protein